MALQQVPFKKAGVLGRSPAMSHNSHNVLLCLFLLLIAPFFAPKDSYANKKLILNTSMTTPLSNTEQTGFVDLVLGEAFRQIGYEIETVLMPAERALINANAGIDDGELLRISGLQKTYPNLVQVPESIIEMAFVVFTRHVTFEVHHWNSLKPYSVAFNTGWKILERNVPKTADKTLLNNDFQLFSVLMKDRADLIIYSRWLGLGYIKQHQLEGIKILHPPLARRNMYTYLHKKHRDLVPKLTKALRAMKSNGRYEALFNKILKPYCQAYLTC